MRKTIFVCPISGKIFLSAISLNGYEGSWREALNKLLWILNYIHFKNHAVNVVELIAKEGGIIMHQSVQFISCTP